MNDGHWTRSDAWVGADVDGSHVMVNVDTGRYVALNASAAAIWAALETRSDAPAISAYVQEQFDVAPDACDASVARTLGEMANMDLIVRAS